MGRRGSKMGIRGKPALFLICVVCLLVIITVYLFKGTPDRKLTPLQHLHHEHVKMGDFDASKFVRDNSPKKELDSQEHMKGKQRNLPGLKEGASNDSPNNLKKEQLDFDMNYDFNEQKDGDRKVHRHPEKHPQNSEQNHEGDEQEAEDVNERKVLEEDPETQTLSGKLQRMYRKPSSGQAELYQSMKHIVHLDLKGAAPKLSYIEKLLPLITKFGATGILVEYEDMFPYTGELNTIAADNSYSQSEISKFLEIAKSNNLEVIPLVQTFGHLEFVLKYEKYINLRENEETPQVITPLVNDTYTLLGAIIDQIISLHKDVRYIHIGCDEVYNLGQGKSSRIMADKGYTKEDMFFQHVGRIVRHIKDKFPRVTPIMWEDELRYASPESFQKHKFLSQVEPMIWAYDPKPETRFSPDMWEKYSQTFKYIWAASSFKGSTGSAQYYTDIPHHLSNHLGWIDVINSVRNVAPNLKFRGVALTGWQRYDHFSTLCELIPAAVPSLAVCLTTISTGGFTSTAHDLVKRVLKCDEEMVSCDFPGSDVYSLVLQLKAFDKEVKQNGDIVSRLDGWLTDYNILHGFGSPGQLNLLIDAIDMALKRYKELSSSFWKFLSLYYDESTVEEWTMVHISQKIKFYNEKREAAKKLAMKRVWPKRPFHNDIVLQQQQHLSPRVNQINPENSRNVMQNFQQQQQQQPLMVQGQRNPNLNQGLQKANSDLLQQNPGALHGQQNFKMAQQNPDLTQQNSDLAQKNPDLTQKNLNLAQQSSVLGKQNSVLGQQNLNSNLNQPDPNQHLGKQYPGSNIGGQNPNQNPGQGIANKGPEKRYQDMSHDNANAGGPGEQNKNQQEDEQNADRHQKEGREKYSLGNKALVRNRQLPIESKLRKLSLRRRSKENN